MNVDKGFVWRPEEFEWIPGAIEAIKRLNQAGFLVVVVTNQSGVARGMYTEEDVLALQRWADAELAERGAHIDAWYYCPHHPDHGEPPYRVDCDCRKPKSGMLAQAIREHDIDPAASFLVGDKQRDLEAASAVGVEGTMYHDGDLDQLIAAILKARASRPA